MEPRKIISLPVKFVSLILIKFFLMYSSEIIII